MDQVQLENFSILSQYENMSTAAQVQNISQPQVSKLLASLEAEVGVKLFDRVGRGIQLNEHGKVFAQYARSALGSMHAGRSAMRNLKNSFLGRLCICTFAYAPILSQCVQGYVRNNPHINIRYTVPSQGIPMDQVDLLLCPLLHGHYLYENHFSVFHKILTENYYIVCSPRFRRYPKEKVSIAIPEFLDAPFVVMGLLDYYGSNNDVSLLEDICGFASMPAPRIAYEVNEFNFKMILVGEGVGMSLLPEACLADAKKIVPDLQIFSIEDYAPSRTVLIAKKKPENASDLAEDFWQYALKFFQ